MGRFGAGTTAFWCVTLDPTAQHFASLSRDLSHSGHYTVLWGSQHVTVPVTRAQHTLPHGALQLRLLNVPPSCCRVGLPEALLDLAGYAVTPCPPGSPPPRPAAGSQAVTVLRYRLGAQANAAVFVVDVLAPPDDPYLHRLPAFAGALSAPGRPVFATFVHADPLRRAPAAARRGPHGDASTPAPTIHLPHAEDLLRGVVAPAAPAIRGPAHSEAHGAGQHTHRPAQGASPQLVSNTHTVGDSGEGGGLHGPHGGTRVLGGPAADMEPRRRGPGDAGAPGPSQAAQRGPNGTSLGCGLPGAGGVVSSIRCRFSTVLADADGQPGGQPPHNRWGPSCWSGAGPSGDPSSRHPGGARSWGDCADRSGRSQRAPQRWWQTNSMRGAGLPTAPPLDMMELDNGPAATRACLGSQGAGPTGPVSSLARHPTSSQGRSQGPVSNFAGAPTADLASAIRPAVGEGAVVARRQGAGAAAHVGDNVVVCGVPLSGAALAPFLPGVADPSPAHASPAVDIDSPTESIGTAPVRNSVLVCGVLAPCVSPTSLQPAGRAESASPVLAAVPLAVPGANLSAAPSVGVVASVSAVSSLPAPSSSIVVDQCGVAGSLALSGAAAVESSASEAGEVGGPACDGGVGPFSGLVRTSGIRVTGGPRRRGRACRLALPLGGALVRLGVGASAPRIGSRGPASGLAARIGSPVASGRRGHGPHIRNEATEELQQQLGASSSGDPLPGLSPAVEAQVLPPPPPLEMPPCPICWNDLDSSEAHFTPCAHAYHAHCLQTWYNLGRASCPLCRYEPGSNAASGQTPPPASSEAARSGSDQATGRYGLIPHLAEDDPPVLPVTLRSPARPLVDHLPGADPAPDHARPAEAPQAQALPGQAFLANPPGLPPASPPHEPREAAAASEHRDLADHTSPPVAGEPSPTSSGSQPPAVPAPMQPSSSNGSSRKRQRGLGPAAQHAPHPSVRLRRAPQPSGLPPQPVLAPTPLPESPASASAALPAASPATPPGPPPRRRVRAIAVGRRPGAGRGAP